jgi:hypothetical protein
MVGSPTSPPAAALGAATDAYDFGRRWYRRLPARTGAFARSLHLEHSSSPASPCRCYPGRGGGRCYGLTVAAELSVHVPASARCPAGSRGGAAGEGRVR